MLPRCAGGGRFAWGGAVDASQDLARQFASTNFLTFIVFIGDGRSCAEASADATRRENMRRGSKVTRPTQPLLGCLGMYSCRVSKPTGMSTSHGTRDLCTATAAKK